MGAIFLLAVWAAIYPTLLAAVTVMLVLPDSKRLLLGYLLGAMAMGVSLGLVVVFVLGGSSAATKTAKHSVNPALELALGVLILLLAFVFVAGRERLDARRERRRAAKAEKQPSRLTRALKKGSPRTTFVVGALLSVPGVTYLAALDLIARKGLPVVTTTLIVVAFNVIMLTLLEVPLLGYAFAPDRTASAVQ